MNIRLIINFVLFQLGWFACVLGGAWNLPWLGTVSVMAILAYHLSTADDRLNESSLIGIAVLLGFVWDSILVATGLLTYQSGMFHSELAPHWIIAMWALFASTLNVSLSWLKDRYFVALIFGAAGGPLAYYAGLKLGAVDMPNQFLALTALGFGWAVIMPFLMWASMRFNGFKTSSTPNNTVEA
ncbi:MAG: DUF2878 domain-containing protein [Gammaproteobacteria bacterium]|nr:DUF2878 domain-containing protein [Gammaproteobacteria bacterium]